MKNSVQSLHAAGLGALRIKRNLNLETDDVVAGPRAVVAATLPDSVIQRGKNYYIYGSDFVLTTNAHSNTVITAHKLKNSFGHCGRLLLRSFIYLIFCMK